MSVITERSHKPMTVIGPIMEVSLDEMAQRVVDTREQHGELLQKYHQVWYESGHTWVYTHFAGVGLMKSPNDLWTYQDIIVTHRPKTIIETGTYQGGSALWFAFLLDLMQIEDGHVFTIDIEDRRKIKHPRITFLQGDSRDSQWLETLKDQLEGPFLISLDSDHSAAHVRAELEVWAPLCDVGDWLVVEDTNIGWVCEEHLVTVSDMARCSCGNVFPINVTSLDQIVCPKNTGQRGDRGARGGVEDYLRAHEGEFRQDVLCERYLLTMHPGGWLQRVARCTHG